MSIILFSVALHCIICSQTIQPLRFASMQVPQSSATPHRSSAQQGPSVRPAAARSVAAPASSAPQELVHGEGKVAQAKGEELLRAATDGDLKKVQNLVLNNNANVNYANKVYLHSVD